MDVYPVLSLGYALYFWDASYWGGGYLGGGGVFAFGIAGDVRYFFNDYIGVWAELGYSPESVKVTVTDFKLLVKPTLNMA
jgi:hypothetical protein